MDEQHLVSRKQEALAWFKQLQHLLTERLEQLEIHPEGRFEWQSWTRPGGGGGTMALLRGETFEKAGVNLSEVHGTLSPAFAQEIPGASEDPSFWAAGILVVVHPRNPQVPAAHMNTRLMITRQSWWGGGGDLTPMAPHGNPEDVRLFHGALEAACDRFDKDWYARFKAQCVTPTFIFRIETRCAVRAAFFTTSTTARTGQKISSSPALWEWPFTMLTLILSRATASVLMQASVNISSFVGDATPSSIWS